MSRVEKLEHIWSTTAPDFRTYADQRFVPGFAGTRVVLVVSAQTKVWKRLDEPTDDEIAAKLPVQIRHLADVIAA